jgi:hypothetical protein
MKGMKDLKSMKSADLAGSGPAKTSPDPPGQRPSCPCTFSQLLFVMRKNSGREEAVEHVV